MAIETCSLALNGQHNLFLDDSGNIATVTGLEACLQNCKTALLAQKNEMIYSMDEGIPTRATLWDQYLPSQFHTAAVATLDKVPGVLRVEAFDVSRNEDEFIYHATIKTEWGIGEIYNG